MGRRFRVTVNGKVYEVEVEEMGFGAPSAPVNPAPSAPVAPSPVTASPAPAPAQASAPAPAPKPSPQPTVGGSTVSAPMPGKILRVNVREGEQVSAGDLLVVLEAMKMENEILAPTSGTVKQVLVKEGDSVNTGDAMVVIG